MPTQTFFNLDQERQQKILRIALAEFANNGYEVVSVNKIVAKSEIAKGSFYQYFDDKKDLYLYLIEVAAQKKIRYLNNYQEQLQGNDFFEDISKLMIFGSKFDLLNPLYSKLINNAFSGPLADESLLKMRQMSYDYLSNLMSLSREKKEIRSDVPLDLAVYFINVLITDFAKYAAKKAGFDFFAAVYQVENREIINNLDLEGMIADLVKLMKHGLANSR